MNSIHLVQSNADSLPPPISAIAATAKLSARSSLFFPSQLSSSPNEPHVEQLEKLPAGRIMTGTASWLAETLLSRWHSYRERLDEYRHNPKPESIHELRVSIRRLISQFVLFSQILPDRGPDKARNFLKHQLESLGPLRDTHVQQMFIRRQMAQFPDLADLLDRLQDREPSLVKRASQNIRRLKTDKLEKWICSLAESLKQQSFNRRTQRELARLALSCADATFAQVLERWRNIDRADPRTIHRTRVAFKKFRYIVESLPPDLTCYSKNDLRRLARYQRRMGNIQDFEVIQESVRSFMKECEHSRLNAFCAYLRKRRARAVRSFLKTSSRLFQFWPSQAIRDTVGG
jgi:CHAD domain-containing protein